MTAYAIIELDTQAPVISFGIPERDGGYIVVPYTINEPELVAAELNGKVATIGPDTIRAEGQLAQGGAINARVFMVDDVGNAETLEAELWMAPVAGDVTKKPSGGIVEGLGGIINKAQKGRLETPDEGEVD